VVAKAEGGGPAAHGMQKLGVEERFAAGEAEGVNAVVPGALQESNRDSDVEPIGPFDRHAAVRTAEVALVGAGEGQVVGPKRPAAASHRPNVVAPQRRSLASSSHEGSIAKATSPRPRAAARACC